jgi:hypothetical protein
MEGRVKYTTEKGLEEQNGGSRQEWHSINGNLNTFSMTICTIAQTLVHVLKRIGREYSVDELKRDGVGTNGGKKECLWAAISIYQSKTHDS